MTAPRRRAVRDVMTREVITVDGHTPFKDVVRMLRAFEIGGMPVLDSDGRVAGVVTEADLLRRQERDTDRHPTGATKARAETAAELMTAPAVAARPDMPLGEAARLMHTRRVKRLPVVDDNGTLVGIVTRADLLSVFLRPDEDIRRDVVHEVVERETWLTPEESGIDVTVRYGVVRLGGVVDSSRLADRLVHLAYGVEGVVTVEDKLVSGFASAAAPPR